MATIQFGAITTTAVTTRQDILTYTPADSLSLKAIVVAGYFTVWSATEANLGTVYVVVGGSDKMEFRITNTDNDTTPGLVVIPFGDGVTFSGSEAVLIEVNSCGCDLNALDSNTNLSIKLINKSSLTIDAQTKEGVMPAFDQPWTTFYPIVSEILWLVLIPCLLDILVN